LRFSRISLRSIQAALAFADDAACNVMQSRHANIFRLAARSNMTSIEPPIF